MSDVELPANRPSFFREVGIIMFKFGIISVALLSVAACAQSSIQPMAKDTFNVDTRGADMCGPSGARNVAFKSAAIEVIRRGADKFIIVNDTTDESFWAGAHNQAMIVKVIAESSPDVANALSARATGAEVADHCREGKPAHLRMKAPPSTAGR